MAIKEKKTRVRSPNYPAITLEKGVELVETLYKNQNQYLVPMEVAARDWGFSPKSSYLSQHIAALSSYGLIDVAGGKDSRKIKVSDLGFKIILDKRPGSEERISLIKEAALGPDIFRKIYDSYSSGLPSDHTLEYDLTTKYKFNRDSIKDFIGILKKTLDYANIFKSGIMGEEKTPIMEPDMNVSDKVQVKDTAQVRINPPTYAANEREIANYPVGPGQRVRILFSGGSPTVESIEKLMKLLELNKEDFRSPETNPDEKQSN